MRVPVIIFVLLWPLSTVVAQNSGMEFHKKTSNKIIYDCYKGDMPVATVLILQHLPNHDEGRFVLEEKKDTVVQVKGDWTVLRGDATDEDAAVVELDTEKKLWYFLRKKNGDLQQLDPSLHMMKPESDHLLRKTKYKDADKKLFDEIDGKGD